MNRFIVFILITNKNSCKAAALHRGGPSFQGYADDMLTPEFEEHLQSLMDLARRERVVLRCAEALPWRCHRSLIADALLVRGIAVDHIMSRDSSQPHQLTPMARVEGTRLTYPPPPEES